jgi:hypothetical protein
MMCHAQQAAYNSPPDDQQNRGDESPLEGGSVDIYPFRQKAMIHYSLHPHREVGIDSMGTAVVLRKFRPPGPRVFARGEPGENATPKGKPCLTFDGFSGSTHSAPSDAVTRFKEAQAVCSMISKAWPNIKPPPQSGLS